MGLMLTRHRYPEKAILAACPRTLNREEGRWVFKTIAVRGGHCMLVVNLNDAHVGEPQLRTFQNEVRDWRWRIRSIILAFSPRFDFLQSDGLDPRATSWKTTRDGPYAHPEQKSEVYEALAS
jgi:hypothetical protein